jgi:hypothetical protein
MLEMTIIMEPKRPLPHPGRRAHDVRSHFVPAGCPLHCDHHDRHFSFGPGATDTFRARTAIGSAQSSFGAGPGLGGERDASPPVV